MSELPMLLLALAAGSLLGAIFYGGLWWTVRAGLASTHPAWWFFASFWLRVGIALAGFYAVGNTDWQRLLACLAGFIGARLLVTWLTREPTHAH